MNWDNVGIGLAGLATGMLEGYNAQQAREAEEETWKQRLQFKTDLEETARKSREQDQYEQAMKMFGPRAKKAPPLTGSVVPTATALQRRDEIVRERIGQRIVPGMSLAETSRLVGPVTKEVNREFEDGYESLLSMAALANANGDMEAMTAALTEASNFNLVGPNLLSSSETPGEMVAVENGQIVGRGSAKDMILMELEAPSEYFKRQDTQAQRKQQQENWEASQALRQQSVALQQEQLKRNDATDMRQAVIDTADNQALMSGMEPDEANIYKTNASMLASVMVPDVVELNRSNPGAGGVAMALINAAAQGTVKPEQIIASDNKDGTHTLTYMGGSFVMSEAKLMALREVMKARET